MKPITMYCAGITPAMEYARQYLTARGITLTQGPGWDTAHLLLDVPSFRPGSPLAEEKNLDTLLSSLPKDVTVWGGNLSHPALEGFHCVDLLKDEQYLAENAAITAHCALQVAAPLLHTTWDQTPVLVIGWGRIGKCLGRLLRAMECPVTIAARNSRDRAALESMGYRTADTAELEQILPRFRLIFNTVPAVMISESHRAGLQNFVAVDLSSKKGIEGSDVVWARGLPGKLAPESSGRLIGETVLRLMKEVQS